MTELDLLVKNANVATATDWVVANLPVDAAEGPFSVYFDLGTSPSEPVQQIPLHVKYSTG